MEWDVMKIMAGLFFMGILPILFALLQIKKNKMQDDQESIRRIIYLLTMISMCGILLWMENTVMILSFISGSTIFRMLVVEGICYVQKKENNYGKINLQKNNRKKKNLYERFEDYIGQIEGSNIFLAVSFILLLFLSADYLFDRGHGQNILGRVDGMILLFAGAAYFIIEGKNVGWKKIGTNIMESIKKTMTKNIIILVITECTILIGCYLLVDGFLAMCVRFSNILPYTVGFLFLPWCVNMINIFLVSPDDDFHMYHSNCESIFSITILLGCCSMYKNIYISTYETYHIILFSLAAILLILPIKTDSRLIGCIRVTVYFALVLFILFH